VSAENTESGELYRSEIILLVISTVCLELLPKTVIISDSLFLNADLNFLLFNQAFIEH